MQQESQILINRLYAGVFTEMVPFVALTPKIVIKPESIFENRTLDGKLDALKTRHALGFLGKPYLNVVIPCVPAYEHSLNISPPFQIPTQGLYFMKASSQSSVMAIASGKRSAILESQTSETKQKKLFRFKGCGNQLKGFNKENNHGVDQTRGHHFFQTSKRELYMNNIINQIFQKQLNIYPPANKPMYMFDYPEEFLKENNILNQLPMVSKFCCVYETQGDRRVGTHLISPMEILFLSLCELSQPQNWKTTFKNKGRIDEKGELIDFVTNFELFVNEGDTFFNTYEKSQQLDTYTTFSDGPLVFKTGEANQIFSKIVKKFVNQGLQKDCLSLLTAIKYIEKSIKIVIKKIGWEIGQIKRSMSKNRISWGFFQDHGKLFHCNAHLNNLIVTKPKKTTESTNYFVLPLDYDLAYSKEEFINIDAESPTYGQNDLNLFEGYLCAEYNAMQMSLFGVELMDFKYGMEDEKDRDVDKSADELFLSKMKRIIFRDSLVKSFIQGMRDNKKFFQEINEEWNDNINDITKLVEVCLFLSLNFQS